MATITSNGVTLTYPDTIEAGETYQVSYSVEANTGREKTVVFEFETANGATERLSIIVGGS